MNMGGLGVLSNHVFVCALQVSMLTSSCRCTNIFSFMLFQPLSGVELFHKIKGIDTRYMG